VCPGKVPAGWSGDVALFLHADGAANAHASGYSFGWPPAELGPRTKRMLKLLGHHYASISGHPPHHGDNYTGDMRGYYAYSRVKADAKILIEHGFLTNPAERAWLTKHTDAIARAWYRALLAYFDLEAHHSPAPAARTVSA
jgi:N-acetylmuramoyl-L-alanine amidase